MSPEPTSEELRAGLEQSFERWRRRIDEQDEPADKPDEDADEDSQAAA